MADVEAAFSMNQRKRPPHTAQKGNKLKKLKTVKQSCGSESRGEEVACEESDEISPTYHNNRPRRLTAKANVTYKEKKMKKRDEDAVIPLKKERVADTEAAAVADTMCSEGVDSEGTPLRRLLDFMITNEEGEAMALEAMAWAEDASLYMEGLILPYSKPLCKSQGFRCLDIGPIITWHIEGYKSPSPATIRVSTESADYIISKPAPKYRKFFEKLQEKADLCVEVFRALSKPDGGNPDLIFSELVGKVSEAMRNREKAGAKAYFANGPLKQHGAFVAEQLSELDHHASGDDQLFSHLEAIRAMAAASAEHLAFTEQETSARSSSSKGITICVEGNGSRNSSSSGGAASIVTSDDYVLNLALKEERKMGVGRGGGRQMKGSLKTYIKINEKEIAPDYPQPTYLKKSDDECNELVVFEGEDEVDFQYREEKLLEDWTLYNGELRLISLEMLPMLAGVDEDITIFGSGIVSADDGGGYCIPEETNSTSNENLSNSSFKGEGLTNEIGEGSHGLAKTECGGLRIYLSAIREWKIEFGANLLFVWIKTDMFWYRLGRPSAQYKAFYEPILQIARLAIDVITLLKAESRVSRLSFLDVVSRIANKRRKDNSKPCTKHELEQIERYMVVHGQIILQQLREYPDQNVQRSAFGSGLEQMMVEKQHTKLKVSLKVARKLGRNNNPSAHLRPDATKRKPMPATTTRLVKNIWSSYYEKMALMAGEAEVETMKEVVEENGGDELEEVQEEDSDEEEVEGAMTLPKTRGKTKLFLVDKKAHLNGADVDHTFVGKSTGRTSNGLRLYANAVIKGEKVSVGMGVVVERESEEGSPCLNFMLVEYMYKEEDGASMIHGRVLEHGRDTVLENVASERELFLTERCEDTPLGSIRHSISLQRRERPSGHQHRKKNFADDEAESLRAKERQRDGLMPEYFYQKLYSPEKGGFFDLPNGISLGDGNCRACEAAAAEQMANETAVLSNNGGFRLRGVEYKMDDFMYLEVEAFNNEGDGEVAAEKIKGSRNVGLKAWALGQLVKVDSKIEKSSGKAVPKKITVRRFFRPEDINQDLAYKSDLREVYCSQKMATVNVTEVMGKCEIFQEGSNRESLEGDDVFFCCCSFDPKSGKLTSGVPRDVKFSTRISETAVARLKFKGKMPIDSDEAEAIIKGKGKMAENCEAIEKEVDIGKYTRLDTLDVFAGCGGLSEGLQQSGVCRTKWAIEYERPAAEAFALNHLDAEVFCENCNVVLRSIMEKGGDAEDCLSSPEAVEQAAAIPEDKKAKLPMPGQVDFINGGPPCQGFSGMNRFNNRTWSKVQCEMILSFLSFADYLRPRYFLLENVRNFVSFNKGQTFRLTLASLLAMGYQVRFGVLQAGNYGVAQSRKRAFIWAAAPGEVLPDWPKQRHVFASSQTGVSLNSKGQIYVAVPHAGKGAPFRSVTVRDTIGDLPPVGNGASKEEIEYGDVPQSWFQKQVRGTETVLRDHVTKEMNELNLARCEHIPKETPGADWRTLPEIMVRLSDGRQAAMIPWCLPNTAVRHNQWKGLFGRLDWEGNFPTSVTDPQPMGKVGMCFHPSQDRIVSVRECARSQGFPDSFRFWGTTQAKHRQIGNAVPPPLARALGDALKAALARKGKGRGHEGDNSRR